MEYYCVSLFFLIMTWLENVHKHDKRQDRLFPLDTLLRDIAFQDSRKCCGSLVFFLFDTTKLYRAVENVPSIWGDLHKYDYPDSPLDAA